MLALLMLLPVSRAAEDVAALIDAVRADTAWIAGGPTRLVGSAHHDAVAARLQAELEAVPGTRVWRHTFPVMVPMVREAVLEVGQGALKGSHRVYPLWPAGVRLNTTPAEGLEGELIYVGDGEAHELHVKRLPGQIAVMEMAGGANWHVLFGLGVQAVL
ncbi:hypothetical protein ACFLSJ_08885, partial [Verrucomicrobiota bacterium]